MFQIFPLSWVDDLVIGRSSSHGIEELKKTLDTKFGMNDRLTLQWFLGMQFSEDSEKLNLVRNTYFWSVIEKFSMHDCYPSKTPADNNLNLVKAPGDEHLEEEKL